MKKALIILLIISLIVLDFLIFHDFFSGERYTFAEYLTGVVSVPIIIILASLLRKNRK
jgi:hypothetical protein